MKGSSESYWKVSKAGGMKLVRTDGGNFQRPISSENRCQPSWLIPLVRCPFREAGYTKKTEGAWTDRLLDPEQAAPGLWWGRDGGSPLSTHRLGI